MTITTRPPSATDLRPQALYRFFSADNTLLYVGITANVGLRWKQHADSKPWWSHVHHATITHYPNRDAVDAAEKAAIRTERPRYNVAHNTPGAAPLLPLVADLVVTGRVPSVLSVVVWANWLVYFVPITYALTRDLLLPAPWLPAVVFAAYMTYALITGRDVRAALLASMVVSSVAGAHRVGMPLPSLGLGYAAATFVVVAGTLAVTVRLVSLGGGRRKNRRRKR